MKLHIALAFAIAIPSVSWAQVESVFSNAEAAEKAQELAKAAQSLRAVADQQCTAQDATQLQVTAKKARAQLAAFPDDHLKYRALFPYSDCRQAMLDVESYALSCAVGSHKGLAAENAGLRWEQDLAACEGAIQSPDLSLTEIE